jgi:hypothetical protein
VKVDLRGGVFPAAYIIPRHLSCMQVAEARQ